MLLFGGLAPLSAAYVQKRVTMATWVQGLTNCGVNTPGQVFNDIENKPTGTTDGITDIKVTLGGQTYIVLHHSAGVSGTANSCTVFWVEFPTGVCKAVIVGRHMTARTYLLLWLNAQAVFTRITPHRAAVAVGTTICPFKKD